MPSKTSSCSATLARKALTGVWPLWALYLAIWIIALPVSMLINGRWHANPAQLSGYYVLDTVEIVGLAVPMVYGVLCALAVFSYLYNSRAAAMYHALPIRREGMFLTQYLSGLAMILVPNAAVLLLTLLSELAIGSVNAGALLQWFLMTSGIGLFFYSLAVFFAMLTGHALALLAIYGVAQFLVVALASLVGEGLRVVLFGFAGWSNTSVFFPFSPLFELYGRVGAIHLYDDTQTLIGYGMQGGGTVALYALCGLVLAVCALLIYRQRHTESAGDVIAVRAMRPVFRYVTAFSVAVSLGLLLFALLAEALSQSVWLLLVCILAAGFVGYYAAEMLLHKSFRVLRRGAKGFACFSAALIVLVAALEFDLLGYERRLPEATDVAAVTVYMEGTRDPALIARAVELHRAVLENRAAVEQGVEEYHNGRFAGANYEHRQLENGSTYTLQRRTTAYLHLEYWMQDGSVMRRSYDIPVTRELLDDGKSPAALLESYLNTPQVLLARLFPGELLASDILYASVMLPQEGWSREGLGVEGTQARALYEAALRDAQSGHLGRTWLLQDEAYHDQRTDTELQFTYLWREGITDAGGWYDMDGVYYSAILKPSPYPMTEYAAERDTGNFGVALTLDAQETLRALYDMGLIEDEDQLFYPYSEASLKYHW